MAHHTTLTSQLTNEKYRNWVKAGLGLKYVKEGLEPFCEDVVKQQHDEIINRIKAAKSSCTGSCPRCLVGVCRNVQARQCPFGQNGCACQYSKGNTKCPNNVCSLFKDEISKVHASNPPAPFWKNTDPQLWCTDPWSLAKCFINAPGYAQKTCAQEIDCTGLLHLFINSKFLQTKLKCQMTGQDVFLKVRQYRNAIYHSHTMELDDAEVIAYIDDMIAVLKDSKELCNRSEAKDAVIKLNEIKHKPFIITSDDEAVVRREAWKSLCQKEDELSQTISDAKASIQTEKQFALSEIKAATDEENLRSQRLNDCVEKVTHDFQSNATHKVKSCQELLDIKTEESVEEINSQKNAALKSIEKVTHDFQSNATLKVKSCQELLDTKTEESVDEINCQKNEALKSIEDACCESEQKLKRTIHSLNQSHQEIKLDHEVRLKHVETSLQNQIGEIGEIKMEIEGLKTKKENVKSLKILHEKQLAYIQQKQDFRKRLIELYQECVVKVSPLLLQPHRAAIPIDDIYITPLMTIIPEHCRHGTSSDKEEAVSSYKQIFECNKRSAKRIYVLGEAGTGKSVFCQKIIQDWCQAHSEPIDDASDNVKLLNHYEFLLYIALRCNNGQDEIESMIFNQYDDPIIKEILENNSKTCLILLDGLDEWNPNTASKMISQFQTNGLPKRKVKRKYTVITTTRPWKFWSLLLRPNEADNKLRLKGFTDDSIEAFVKKAVQELNRMFGSDKNPDICIEAINKCKVVDLKNIPFVLHQMVCLWYDGKLEEASQSNIYCNMLSLIFDWAIQRDPEGALLKPNQLCFERNFDFVMPQQLAKSKTLEEFRSVLRITSELAYKTLFSESKEMTLSFEKHILARIPIPDAIVKYLISIGILTEVRPLHFGVSGRIISSYSFVHKSMHEFLAAVFINDMINRTVDTLRIKDDILRDVFVHCKTIEDILQNSFVLIMLSGFNPDLVPSISSLIYKIACDDDKLADMRENIHVLLPSRSFAEEIMNIHSSPYVVNANLRNAESVQKLICDCISEAQLNAIQPIAEKNVLADVICSGFDSALKDIWPFVFQDSVSSLNVFSNRYFPISDEVLQFITCIGRNLLSLVFDFKMEPDPEMLICILKLLSDSAATLKLFALRNTQIQYTDNFFFPFPPLLAIRSFTRRRLESQIFQTIPELHTLQAIQLYGIKLDYHDAARLCDYLRKAVNLRQISLRKLSCRTGGDDLYVSLPEYGNLEVLDIDFSCIQVVYFSVKTLQTVSLDDISFYYQLTSSFECLKNAPQLKKLIISVNRDNSLAFKHKKVTRQCAMLLKTLPLLKTLILSRFGLSGNIFLTPRKIRNLKRINIYNSHFYCDSWNKILDSIIALPNAVMFESFGLTCDGYDEEFFHFHPSFKELCNVYLTNGYVRFSTKASDLQEQTDDDKSEIDANRVTDDAEEEDWEEEETDSAEEGDYSEESNYSESFTTDSD